MNEIRIDCTKGKDIAYDGRKPEIVEFCTNWCKRFKRCGMLFDHVSRGERSCDLCRLKHHLIHPIKIAGVEANRYVFAPATKDEANQMLLAMPPKSGAP